MAREGALLGYGIVACVAGALAIVAGATDDAVALAIGRGYGIAQLASGIASLALWARGYRPASAAPLSIASGTLLFGIAVSVVIVKPALALTAVSVFVAVMLVLGSASVAQATRQVRLPAGNGLRRTRSI